MVATCRLFCFGRGVELDRAVHFDGKRISKRSIADCRDVDRMHWDSRMHWPSGTAGRGFLLRTPGGKRGRPPSHPLALAPGFPKSGRKEEKATDYPHNSAWTVCSCTSSQSWSRRFHRVQETHRLHTPTDEPCHKPNPAN